MSANLENSAVWPQDWKRSVFIPILKKENAKECSNYHRVALISHAIKVMLKILQARLQQYMNRKLPDVQEKAEEPDSFSHNKPTKTASGSWVEIRFGPMQSIKDPGRRFFCIFHK